MQLKFPRIMAKPSAGLQWQSCRPCLWLLSHLSLPAGYIGLLFYALVWEAGNIVSLPTKQIGFYNFCLWNQKAEELDCLPFKDLEKLGISKVALVLSRVCVYSTPVLCLFVATTVLQALWFKDKDGWKLVRNLLVVVTVILPVGLALFSLQTRRWIHVSELGEVFAALAGAQVLLLLHEIITAMYLAQFKDTLSPEELFPPKGPLRSV
ncbi:transmembrane protein 140 [Tiliqua scincoides]|uniref:transmembrane protein 140 n=1 Tax=Tiliqua scincoides TaxID=71010 RepID=UPI0034628C5F